MKFTVPTASVLSVLPACVLLSMTACGPPTQAGDPLERFTPSSPGTADLLLALLAGDEAAEHTLAWGTGFPVRRSDELTFVHRSDAASCGLTGAFNDWEVQAMERTGALWHTLAQVEDFEEDARYKFVCDEVFLADPLARSYGYDEFGEISHALAPVAGHLERWPGFEHGDLLTRDLTVWVPSGSAPDVLIAADGQNLFDPGAPWGGWRVDQALEGRNVLVVGVHNTADRMTEYSHVDDHVLDQDWQAQGDAYVELVHEGVRAHIENAYTTSGRYGLIGSSLGGLISLHIARTHPDDFDFVASLSGTLGWGRFHASNPTMQELWSDVPQTLTVYADSGGGPGENGCEDPDGDGFSVDDPDASDNYCVTRQFVDALAAQGFTWDSNLYHWHEPDAPHNEAAWAARVARPLALFAP